MKDPDLIILDEPLHGLDVSNKKKAAAIIEQFCDRPGKTLIYVTHYPHELPACVDKRFELVKHSWAYKEKEDVPWWSGTSSKINKYLWIKD